MSTPPDTDAPGSQIISARPGLSRLIDTYPELAKHCEHVSLASIESELFPLSDQNVTLVDKDSIIANFLKLNSDTLKFDMKNALLVDGHLYVVTNDVVTKCLSQVYDNILKP